MSTLSDDQICGAEMKTFHGDIAIREKYLQRLKGHAAADEIIKGLYWENGKGCAIGCTIHSDKHDAYEDELGIPVVLAYIEDTIFENLPNHLAKTWPIRFFEAIPFDVDLELIWPKFGKWLSIDSDFGDTRFHEHGSMINVRALFDRWIKGNKPTLEDWTAAGTAPWTAGWAIGAAAVRAARATEAAAEAAAEAAKVAEAAEAAVGTAAEAAAEAAEGAAARAAWTAARAAAAAYYVVMSEKLLELLKEAK
jgi:hypothetical protein